MWRPPTQALEKIRNAIVAKPEKWLAHGMSVGRITFHVARGNNHMHNKPKSGNEATCQAGFPRS